MVCVLVGLPAGTSATVNIETVLVGDPGNVGDTRYPDPYRGVFSFGGVNYTYAIGKYEVTAGQYTTFLNAVAGVDTYELYNIGMVDTSYGSGILRIGGGTVGNPYTYWIAVDFVNRPVHGVTYWNCCRFANWLHNGQPSGAQGTGTTETGAYTLDGYHGHDHGRPIQRNPGSKWAVTSEDEWYKAAYYKGGSANAGYWDYPTSSDTFPGRDMADVSGNNANWASNPIDPPYYSTIVGEFQNSESPYGTFDQGGNVWEWNEALLYSLDDYPYRGLRGGSFSNTATFGMHAGERHSSYHWPDFGSIGFRVSAPEPATIVMLALAGVATLRRKRA